MITGVKNNSSCELQISYLKNNFIIYKMSELSVVNFCVCAFL